MISWNQIGDWNPQLIREVKGRLTPSNTWIVIGVAILAQAISLLIFRSMLPDDATQAHLSTNRYCLGGLPYPEADRFYCEWDASGHLPLNMSLWWRDVFRLLGWALPLVWITGSAYVLIADLTKERNQGTLNFIQLSPRSNTTILLGKLLGVPILLHLLLVFLLPLHGIAAVLGQISPVALLWFYVGSVAVWALVGSTALFFAALGGSQPWLGSTMVGLGLHPLLWLIVYGLWGEPGESIAFLSLVDLRWFDLPIGSSLWVGGSFSVICCLVAMGWIWWALVRRFRSPEITVLSKRSSYLLTLCLHLTALGFVWTPLSDQFYPYYDLLEYVVLFWVLQIPVWAGVIWGLSPHRQAVLDWVLYRRERASSNPFTLLRDLVWGETSPAILALGINLAFVVILWTSVILVVPISVSEKGYSFLGLMAGVPLWLIYGLIGQFLLLIRGFRHWWSVVSLFALLVLPLVGVTIWHETVGASTGLWAYLVYGYSTYAVDQFALPELLLGLLLPWIVLGLLLVAFVSRIRTMGRSQMQQILSSAD